MNKSFFKFILRLIILIIVLLIVLCAIFSLSTKMFGMFIFDEEYGLYKQTLDYIDKTNDYNKVIILGDSTARSGIIPNEISGSAYNLSLPGASVIEQYYLMNRYLENHEPPKTIIMMYFMGSYNTIDEFFWKRTIYFDCLNLSEFKDILNTGLFPTTEKNPMIRFLKYKLAFPDIYYAAVKNAISKNRYDINKTKYDASENNRGHHFFGTQELFEPNNMTISTQEDFVILDILDYYMNKCIELCEENGIQVIIEQHPINISTLYNMKPDFREGYIEYMKDLQERYPNVIINTEIDVEDNHWFGDFTHLNQNGAHLFSIRFKEKYEEYLK